MPKVARVAATRGGGERARQRGFGIVPAVAPGHIEIGPWSGAPSEWFELRSLGPGEPVIVRAKSVCILGRMSAFRCTGSGACASASRHRRSQVKRRGLGWTSMGERGRASMRAQSPHEGQAVCIGFESALRHDLSDLCTSPFRDESLACRRPPVPNGIARRMRGGVHGASLNGHWWPVHCVYGRVGHFILRERRLAGRGPAGRGLG